jgi:precorrin-4 methylase
MTVVKQTNVVDGAAVRRYAASIITYFENNSMLPESDGKYGITIDKSDAVDMAVCTVETNGSVTKIHSVDLKVFDGMNFPMRSFDSMHVKLTRDVTEVPFIEANSITLRFNGTTIRVSA